MIVPLLLGSDAFSDIHAVLDFSEDVLFDKFDGRRVPLIKKGHIYVECTAATSYTHAEPRRILRRFKHPSAERLYAVIQRADHLGCRFRLLHNLEDVVCKCEVCQRVSGSPGRYCSSLSQVCAVFNATVCLDLITPGTRSVLHLIEKATRFSAAHHFCAEFA